MRSGSVSVTVPGQGDKFDLPGLQESISHGGCVQLGASAGCMCLAKIRMCANQLVIFCWCILPTCGT